MTAYTNRLVFALPYSAANLERMQRLGVAVCEEEASLTGAQRLAIANGTTPIEQVLAYDTETSTQSRNFQTVYSFNGSTTKDFYLGSCSMTAAWWSRIQARFASLPAQFKYARWTFDGEVWTLLESNVAALSGSIGTTITLKEALDVLKPKVYGT